MTVAGIGQNPDTDLSGFLWIKFPLPWIKGGLTGGKEISQSGFVYLNRRPDHSHISSGQPA